MIWGWPIDCQSRAWFFERSLSRSKTNKIILCLFSLVVWFIQIGEVLLFILGWYEKVKFGDDSLWLVGLFGDVFLFDHPIKLLYINGFDLFFETIGVLEVIKYYWSLLVGTDFALLFGLLLLDLQVWSPVALQTVLYWAQFEFLQHELQFDEGGHLGGIVLMVLSHANS